ncbi:hypothetical protein Leryth_024734 [Lithospermum erythrorhizon]|nr:hypothetical protein Leryth_024734 [Lithospermum erythrorhizon]
MIVLDGLHVQPVFLFLMVYRILVILATLLRTALAFRWDGAFLLPGCCDPFNEKALRASRGAAFQLPIVSGSWSCLAPLADEFRMKMLGGHPPTNKNLMTVSLLSQSYAHSIADTPLCLVLGSEGSGLSKQTVQECELISIPMEGNFESLNVSVAGGIFLYMLQPANHQDDFADLKRFT